MVVSRKKTYIPDQCDIVWVDFNPQRGHEQAGMRPALVMSPASYNKTVGLALMCPITSKIKGYPFEVILPKKLKADGAILADQIKSLDWRIRNIKFEEQVPIETFNEVVDKIKLLL